MKPILLSTQTSPVFSNLTKLFCLLCRSEVWELLLFFSKTIPRCLLSALPPTEKMHAYRPSAPKQVWINSQTGKQLAFLLHTSFIPFISADDLNLVSPSYRNNLFAQCTMLWSGNREDEKARWKSKLQIQQGRRCTCLQSPVIVWYYFLFPLWI